MLQVVNEARSWLGTPYHHQQAVKGVGCDCLGLIRGVYYALDLPPVEKLPPYSRSWGDADQNELMLAAADRYLIKKRARRFTPGNVLVFRMRKNTVAKHAAIYIGSGRMIHACEGNPVSEVNMGGFWTERVVAVYQFPLEGK